MAPTALDLFLIVSEKELRDALLHCSRTRCAWTGDPNIEDNSVVSTIGNFLCDVVSINTEKFTKLRESLDTTLSLSLQVRSALACAPTSPLTPGMYVVLCALCSFLGDSEHVQKSMNFLTVAAFELKRLLLLSR